MNPIKMYTASYLLIPASISFYVTLHNKREMDKRHLPLTLPDNNSVSKIQVK